MCVLMFTAIIQVMPQGLVTVILYNVNGVDKSIFLHLEQRNITWPSLFARPLPVEYLFCIELHAYKLIYLVTTCELQLEASVFHILSNDIQI